MKLTTLQALELLMDGQRLRCTSGPMQGQSIQATKTVDEKCLPNEGKIRVRLQQMVVTIEDFLSCEWEHVQACPHCDGSGWVRCTCGAVAVDSIRRGAGIKDIVLAGCTCGVVSIPNEKDG